jgi:hypothetical protein
LIGVILFLICAITQTGKGRGESLKALEEVVTEFRDLEGAVDLNACLLLDH